MPGNVFEDLIPKGAERSRNAVAPKKNAFSDLIPGPVQHAPGVVGQRGEGISEEEPSVNIAMKGNKKPDSLYRPTDVKETTAHGALFGLSDEIGAALGVPSQIIENLQTGEGPTAIGEVYDQNLGAVRTMREKTRLDFPTLAPISEAGGALATAIIPIGAAAKGVQLSANAPRLVRAAVAGKGIVPKVIRGSAAGGVIGGATGFGEGEGLEDRLSRAEGGAETGAALGAAIPAGAKVIGQGVRLVKAVSRAVTAPVRSLADKETFAAGKVAEALQRDEISPERAAKLLKLKGQVKPDTVLADVGGENTQNLLRASANVPSEARGKLVRELFVRQERQLDRLRADVGDAFGDTKTFNGTVENLTLARKQNAKPLFDAAFQTGTPWTVQLQSVLSRPLTRKLVGRAEEAAANRGEQFKALFAKVGNDGKVIFERVPDTEALHRVKMEIDSAISQLKRREETGLGNVNIRDLTILKKDLLNAIDNKLYKRALNQYAGDSAAVNAIDDGFENGLSMEPEAIGETLKGLTKAEADLWRLGFARKVVNQLRDSGRAGANRAEILNSPKYLDRIKAALNGTPSGREFMRKLQLERKMVQTRDAVRGNSTTARQLAEGMEAGVDADNVRDAVDMGGKLLRGDMIGALVSWVGRAKNMATGLRPEVADQIIKMLTSKDPALVARAQKLVEKEIAKLTRRQGTAERVERGVNVGGFSALPSLASPDGQTATQ